MKYAQLERERDEAIAAKLEAERLVNKAALDEVEHRHAAELELLARRLSDREEEIGRLRRTMLALAESLHQAAGADAGGP